MKPQVVNFLFWIPAIVWKWLEKLFNIYPKQGWSFLPLSVQQNDLTLRVSKSYYPDFQHENGNKVYSSGLLEWVCSSLGNDIRCTDWCRSTQRIDILYHWFIKHKLKNKKNIAVWSQKKQYFASHPNTNFDNFAQTKDFGPCCQIMSEFKFWAAQVLCSAPHCFQSQIRKKSIILFFFKIYEFSVLD